MSFAADSYTIYTFAGSNSSGDGGVATAALIGEASGIAFDTQGNCYLADSLAHRVRKISSKGVITAYVGTGTPGYAGDGGSALQAQLNSPYGLAVDTGGNLYIADLGNAVVRKVTPGGVISTYAGGGQFSGEGAPATESILQIPRNLTVAGDGTLYISDFGAHRVVAVQPDGRLRYVAGNGTAGSSGDTAAPTAAQLRNPAGLALDSSGWLYIADSGNKRIRRVANGRIGTVTPNTGTLVLYTPMDVAVDLLGNLYVADGRSDETLRVSTSGVVTSIHAGSRSIAVSPSGEIWFGLGMRVRRYWAGTVSVAAGTGYFTYGGDGGAAAEARLCQPSGLALDASGVTYIADTLNHRIRRVSLDGKISTIAGTGVAGFSGDGKAATAAQLDSPASVTVDASYNLYILDAGNRRIRKVTPGGVISTIAGTGLAGYSGDGGAAIYAEFDSPAAISATSAGELLIADTGNHRIRRIGLTGIITTVAGLGYKGDAGDGGSATNALLNAPQAVAADETGNLYIADTGNKRVRKVDTAGVISALGSAQWSAPAGLAVASDGSLVVTDSGLQRIRRIDTAGSTGTLGGSGLSGFLGDGGPALQAALNKPIAVALNTAGDILFADSGNDRIRLLTTGAVSAPITDEVRVASVVNAASLLEGAVAPGELVQVTAAGLAANAKFSFDDVSAPVQSRDGEQVILQVPYELAGKTAALLRITQPGATAIETLISVATAAPGLYAEKGKGQVYAFNENGELNSLLQPATRGSVATVFCTGEGQTNPAGVTGRVIDAPAPTPALEVRAQIAGAASEVVEAAEAPGLVGVLQLKLRIPGGFIPSGVVPITVTVGGHASQAGVTIVID